MKTKPYTLDQICRARRGLPPRNYRRPLWPLCLATLVMWALAIAILYTLTNLY